MTTIRILTGLVIVFAAWQGAAEAREIRGVVITGSTIDLGFAEITEKASGEMTPLRIKAIEVEITDRYHRRGYAGTHVEKILVRKDGILEIRVRESKIAAVIVSGIHGTAAARLRESISPVAGELFNSDLVKERADASRRALQLSRVKISVENNEGTPDVLLRVEAEESPAVGIGGGISYEPVYGISPALSLDHGTGMIMISLRGDAGYRDADFRKLTGGARVCAPITGSWTLFADYELSKKRDTWQERGIDFLDISHTPSTGIRWSSGFFTADVSLGRSYISLEGYGDRSPRQNDTHMDLVARYSDARGLIDHAGATRAVASVRSGSSSITGERYLRGEWSASVAWSPAVWMRFRPRALAGHSTTDERYYRMYVFDKNLAGFFGDFSATRTRFIAGIDLEVEAYPETLYLGPLVNSGRYLDESGSWKTKTGAGAAASARLGGFSFIAQYAWDLTGSVRDGGVIFSAEGTF